MKVDQKGGKGKGLYATKDFCSEDVIILETPLVSRVSVYCHVHTQTSSTMLRSPQHVGS